MRIQAIRISGFRGIPPTDSAPVELDLAKAGDAPLNLLLFGPNAFGKSSIADALEWFFRERVRCSDYFEGYSDADTVHLNVGKPGFPSTAFIELDLYHNGQVHTVRKELDAQGRKCTESLGTIAGEIAKLQGEVVVLDHDKFREFVAAASRDRWRTFSSLIGYEELDQFRAGMDSLTGKSLSDQLNLPRQQKDLEHQQTTWSSDVSRALARCGIDVESPEPIIALRSAFMRRLEIALASMDIEAPSSIEDISERYWSDLRRRVGPRAEYVDARQRLAKLEQLACSLQPISDTFEMDLHRFAQAAARLDSKKDQFSKRVLADFYRLGLQIVSEREVKPATCPLCDRAIPRDALQSKIRDHLTALDFEDIEREQQALAAEWQALRGIAHSRSRDLQRHSISEVDQAFRRVSEWDSVAAAIELSSFDLNIIQQWADSCRALASAMAHGRDTARREMAKIRASIDENAGELVTDDIETLSETWTAYTNLARGQRHIEAMQRKLDIVRGVAQLLRDAAKDFRDELSDLSGRVVELINSDVDRYYAVLHPDDRVKPFLHISITGSQRTVQLRCDYHGNHNRDAASLLSESHRNSLGLAIHLAFMHYKRRVGSPAEFCIFDDVTQSFDTSHRVTLLHLLEDPRFLEISGLQVIFLTHDRTLADLVKRPGEQRHRDNWLRYDIRNWWLKGMLLEPCKDPYQRANDYLQAGDEIAAAIYARRTLEGVYKAILGKCGVRVRYNPKPWTSSLEDYRTFILAEVQELWEHGEGFVDPTAVNFTDVFTSQRILNYTVHESEFLDSPMTLPDVRAALAMIDTLRTMFTCHQCGAWYHTLRKGANGHPPCCKKCHGQLP